MKYLKQSLLFLLAGMNVGVVEAAADSGTILLASAQQRLQLPLPLPRVAHGQKIQIRGGTDFLCSHILDGRPARELRSLGFPVGEEFAKLLCQAVGTVVQLYARKCVRYNYRDGKDGLYYESLAVPLYIDAQSRCFIQPADGMVPSFLVVGKVDEKSGVLYFAPSTVLTEQQVINNTIEGENAKLLQRLFKGRVTSPPADSLLDHQKSKKQKKKSSRKSRKKRKVSEIGSDWV